MKVPVSVVVITKNEETRLAECLQSVTGWAQEIIVVDDQSTDRTQEIAQRYTDKVLVRKMEIEGKHRNWAYAQAANEWVLTLDADERITPALQEEIDQALARNHTNVIFTIPRKNHLGDYWLRWGGQYPSAQLKLFRKGIFRWEEVDVHPRAIYEGDCGHLSCPMIHYTYRTIADFLRKLNAQTNLEAKKWFRVYRQDPRKAHYKMNLTHALWRSCDRFIRAYFVKQGWRDGFRGFIAAHFASLYQLVSYAKYWELKQQEK